MFVLMLVGHLDEEAAEEGMYNGAKEDDRRDKIKSTLLPCPVFELFPDAPVLVRIFFPFVFSQGKRENCVLILIERVGLLCVGWLVFSSSGDSP